MSMELKKYKLGELLDVTRGASLSGEYYATEGEYIRLTCGNFDYNNNCFKENTSKDNLYYTGSIKPEFIMEKGDIITPLTEQAIGLLGSTAMIPESGKYIQSQDVAKIVCKKDLLYPNYAYYLVSSQLVKNQLSAAAQQTKIRHTSPDKIKDCTVWIPDIENQKWIGDLLASIDRKIALNRAINRNLEALAKQIYDYWFVQFDFPDENGRPYKSSGGKMVWNETLKRSIPQQWKVDSIGNIVVLLKDGTHNPPKRVECGVPLLTGTMFGDNFLDYSKATYITKEDYDTIHSQYQPQEGDVIMTKIGTIGNVNYIRSKDLPIAIHCNSALLRFPMEWDKVYPYFLCKSPLFKSRLKAVKGQSIQEFVSLDRIASIQMEIPSIDVIKKFNLVINPIFKALAFSVSQIETQTKQRDELLPLLMNGQVGVETRNG